MDEMEVRSPEERELRLGEVVEELQGQQKVVEGVPRASWCYGSEHCAQLGRRAMAGPRTEGAVLAVHVQLEVEEVPA